MQHDVGAAELVCHGADRLLRAGVAEAPVAVDLPHFAVDDGRVLLGLLLRLRGQPSLHEPRIESLRQQHDVFAPDELLQLMRDEAEHLDLMFHARAPIRVVRARDRALNVGDEFVGDAAFVAGCGPNGVRAAEGIDHLRHRDLQRVEGSEVARIFDRRMQQLAIGGECREEAEAVVDVDGSDGDEIAPAEAAGDEVARRVLRAAERRRRGEREIEEEQEIAPRRGIQRRDGFLRSLGREVDGVERLDGALLPIVDDLEVFFRQPADRRVVASQHRHRHFDIRDRDLFLKRVLRKRSRSQQQEERQQSAHVRKILRLCPKIPRYVLFNMPCRRIRAISCTAASVSFPKWSLTPNRISTVK